MAKVPNKQWLPFIDSARKRLRADKFAALDKLLGEISDQAEDLKEEKDLSFEDITLRLWIPGIARQIKEKDGTTYSLDYSVREPYIKFNIELLFSMVINLIKNLENHPDLYVKFNQQVGNKGSFAVNFDFLYKDKETETETCDIEIPKPQPQ